MTLPDLNAEALSGNTSATIPIAQLVHAAGFCDWAAACKLADAIAALPAVDGEFARGVEAAVKKCAAIVRAAGPTMESFHVAIEIEALSTASVGMGEPVTTGNAVYEFPDLQPAQDTLQVQIGGYEDRKSDDLLRASNNLLPYLRYAIGPESPGFHPTMPSAVAAFESALSALSSASASERSSSQSSEKET